MGVAAIAALTLPACFLDDAAVICPAWSTAGAGGTCERRAWTLPGAEDGLGDPWAQHVMAAVDGRGRGIVGYAWTEGLEVLEEGDPGSWSVRRAGEVVGGSIPSDLVAGVDGSAAFAWSVVSGSEQTLYLSERDAAGGWCEPESDADALSFPTHAYQPRLATNRAGEWIVAWNQWRSEPHFGVCVGTRERSSAPWSRPADRDDVLSLPIFFSNAPLIALNDSGQAIITWYQSLGGPLRAFVSERSGPGDPFSRVTEDDTLSPAEGAVDSDPIAAVKPAIAADGSAAVAWAGENNAGSVLVYLATRDAAGAWKRPRDVDDVFSIPQGYARGVQIAFGPRGDLYVVWYQDAGGGDTVYAARRGPDGAWAEGGRAPMRLSTPGAQGYLPKIAVGPEGSVVVVWSEHEGDGPMRIAARRTGAASEPWGPIEVLSPDTGDDAVHPSVAMGPGDRAIAAWAQGPAAAHRVMIARVE